MYLKIKDYIIHFPKTVNHSIIRLGIELIWLIMHLLSIEFISKLIHAIYMPITSSTSIFLLS